MSQHNKTIDIVCRMEVEPKQFPYSYLGIDYSFCAQQCQDRFIANPYLYIGKPGTNSPKYQGLNIIKHRILTLDEPIPEELAVKLEFALNKMMGVKKVNIDKNTVDIVYDLLELTTTQIENTVKAIGVSLTEKWSDKLMRAFIHYVEETKLDALEEQYKKQRSCHK